MPILLSGYPKTGDYLAANRNSSNLDIRMIMIIISYLITRRLNHALYLDAWLERSDPRLRLLESGELSLEDIQDKGL